MSYEKIHDSKGMESDWINYLLEETNLSVQMIQTKTISATDAIRRISITIKMS